MYVCVMEVRCLGGGDRVVTRDLCTYFTLYCVRTITSDTIREQELKSVQLLVIGNIYCRVGSEATNRSAGQSHLGQHIFVCLCVTLRNARRTSFSARAYSFSAQVYSRSEGHPYNIRTWTAIYITKILWYKINDYGFQGLHDEYTYQAANTHTRQYALSIVTLTTRAHAECQDRRIP